MKTDLADRYFPLSRYLFQRFGTRVHKIPLDGGFSCPNRDGTLTTAGCVFCNAHGSGTGLALQGLDLAGQWSHWRARLTRSRGATLFLAYLQSFSNTHGPVEKLAAVLGQLAGLPGLAGLSIGTRPDCLDLEKLDLLASFPAPEVHLELGLQSANPETLQRINRGHGPRIFANMTRQARERGLKVVAHVMAGLPGETGTDFLNTVDFVAKLPVHGIKLHNTLVLENTELARLWRAGEYAPLTLETYAGLAASAVARMRPDMVIHRLNADPAPNELLAPDWAAHKDRVLNEIRNQLDTQDIFQGAAESR